MTTPTEPKAIARATARALLQIQAIHVRPDDPFTLTSGRLSPVYIDCRKLISFPRARRAIMDMALTRLGDQAGFEAFDAIAGGETAGIPFAAWLAERTMQPMLYVRKQPKGFGRQAQIEGELTEGQRVLLVEDLATDGGSKVNFVEALRTAGATVEHTFVIFHYGIFERSREIMSGLGVRLHALATWWDVLEVVTEARSFTSTQIRDLERFLEDPEGWSAERTGS